jgi:MoxR-like ATPase
LQGRDHVTGEDVQAVAPDCLRHRIIPSYDARAEGKSNDDLLTALLKLVAIP